MKVVEHDNESYVRVNCVIEFIEQYEKSLAKSDKLYNYDKQLTGIVLIGLAEAIRLLNKALPNENQN